MTERATHTFWAYLDNVWTDITSDLIGELTAGWGMMGNGPTDFVAGTGTARFNMNNYTTVGKYSFSHSNRLSGWTKGTPIRDVYSYDSQDYVRFKGYLDTSSSSDSEKTRIITAVDWMEYAAKHPIVNPGILADQTGDEVLTTTLALMPSTKQPAAVDFDEGLNVFPTAFDTVTSHTTAMDEFVKVANSEIGSVYLLKDTINGETLRFEGWNTRTGKNTLSLIPIEIANSGILLLETGDNLLLETGDNLLLNQTQTVSFVDDPTIVSHEITDGERIINRFTVYAQPRSIDASPVILFQLNEPIRIVSGGTIVIKGNYVNSAGGEPINANPDDMITPVINTDYKAWTVITGSGTDFTADLEITPGYGTEGFSHTVYNSGIYDGWITLFNCRGYGIYIYNQIENSSTDSTSRDNYGTQSDSLTQKYKNTLEYGALFGDIVIENEKEPRFDLYSITINANKSVLSMLAFLNLDVGDLIGVTRTTNEIDAYFYIQSVEYSVDPGGFVLVKHVLKMGYSLDNNLTPLAVEFASVESERVEWKYIPTVSGDDVTEFTSCGWVYLDTVPAHGHNFMSVYTGNADTGIFNRWSFQLRFNGSGDVDLAFYSSLFDSQAGTWNVPLNSFGTGTWAHIAVTYNIDTSADPVIYVDGSSLMVSEIQAAAGSKRSQIGAALSLGNIDGSFSIDGKMKDWRFYNRILTAAEIAEMYNSGTPDMSLVNDEALAFQAFAVETKNAADYIDVAISTSSKIRDVVKGYVGTVTGAPVGRDF